MYSRQEASGWRKKFWTSFGQYMQPLQGAGGRPVNWLNYKTGIRHLYFRMDADNKKAGIGIELHHADPLVQGQYFEKLRQLKSILEHSTGEEWDWNRSYTNEERKPISRIGTTLTGVNLFDTGDWPAIISFLKPRILALDEFWDKVKEGFE